MPIETHVYASGAWRKAKEVYVKDQGVWRNLKEIWVKEQGVWRKVFGKSFEFTTDISGFNYNLRDAVMATGQWDGVTPVEANLRVVGNLGSNPPRPPRLDPYTNNSVRRRMMEDYANYPAFDSGSLPAGSEINLTIMPGVYLVGAGGSGGQMQSSNIRASGPDNTLDAFPWHWEDGGPGSPAIRTSVLTRITNNGVIGGGGGGGAGGLGAVHESYWRGKSFSSISQGGGGGGGAGLNGGYAEEYPQGDAPRSNFGSFGTLTTGGKGGSVWLYSGGADATPGGNGGDLGQPGGDGGSQLPLDKQHFARHIRYGGKAGAAVIGSSNVIWQAYGDVRGLLA